MHADGDFRERKPRVPPQVADAMKWLDDHRDELLQAVQAEVKSGARNGPGRAAFSRSMRVGDARAYGEWAYIGIGLPPSARRGCGSGALGAFFGPLP